MQTPPFPVLTFAEDAAVTVAQSHCHQKGHGGNGTYNSSAWFQQLWKPAIYAVHRFYSPDHDTR